MRTDQSTKTFSWLVAGVLCACVALITGVFSVALQTHGLNVAGFHLTPSADAKVSAAAMTAPSKPVRLIIPSIGVNAHIQDVGLDWHGTGDMGIPTNFTDVAWYEGGPLPGTPGSAVIDGHYDGKDVKEAVFYNLGKLKPGELVEVKDANGTVWRFKVVRTTLYDYDAPTTSIFTNTDDKPHLNLITCGGTWNKGKELYNKRVVVFTDLAATTAASN